MNDKDLMVLFKKQLDDVRCHQTELLSDLAPLRILVGELLKPYNPISSHCGINDDNDVWLEVYFNDEKTLNGAKEFLAVHNIPHRSVICAGLFYISIIL